MDVGWDSFPRNYHAEAMHDSRPEDPSNHMHKPWFKAAIPRSGPAICSTTFASTRPTWCRGMRQWRLPSVRTPFGPSRVSAPTQPG